ncbi:hypothetical protein BT63DRAFT_449743 [Microthyrium microscopicum]|uniref:Uncharacterized protein n=1 Tax=Microthyrium microscopicum TaxID=703497 RepID=A0A6A6USL0_9PEZI|nr:hypothetical protein BT63DRAFT_449743 [Microthyrium microscopicum]
MSQEAGNTDLMDRESNETASPNPVGGRKKPAKLNNAVARQPPPQEDYYDDEYDEGSVSEPSAPPPMPRGKRRMIPVHQSRIRDRPPKPAEKDSSLKIKIELDLEVEVEIYARVKGDVTIGLL